MYIVYSQSFKFCKKNGLFRKKNISFFKFVPKLKNDYFYQNLLKNLFV